MRYIDIPLFVQLSFVAALLCGLDLMSVRSVSQHSSHVVAQHIPRKQRIATQYRMPARKQWKLAQKTLLKQKYKSDLRRYLQQRKAQEIGAHVEMALERHAAKIAPSRSRRIINEIKSYLPVGILTVGVTSLGLGIAGAAGAFKKDDKGAKARVAEAAERDKEHIDAIKDQTSKIKELLEIIRQQNPSGQAGQ